MPAGLTLLSLLVFVRIGAPSLWVDEAFSVGTARLPLNGIWTSFTGLEPNMNLYYLLLHVLTGVAGSSEAAVRSISALAAVATVPAVWLLGRRLAGETVAWVAALLLVVHGTFVTYAREARGYSLAALLLTLATHRFLSAVERPSIWRWCSYALLAAAATYVHFLSGLVVVAHVASLAFLPRDRIPWRPMALGGGVLGLLVLPLALLIAGRGAAPLHWIDEPTWYTLVDVWWNLAGNAEAPLAALLFVCVLVGTVATVRRVRAMGRSDEGWRAAVPMCWLLVPILLLIAVSFVVPMFIARYLTLVFPALTLMAAVGIAWLPRASLRGVAVGLVAAVALVGSVQVVISGVKDDWRSTVGHVVRRARPKDSVIVFAPHGIWAYRYYEERLAPVEERPPVIYPGEVTPGTYSPETFAGPFEAIAAAPETSDRIWVVLNQFDEGEADAVIAAVDRRYRWVSAQGFHGMWIHLFELRRPS